MSIFKVDTTFYPRELLEIGIQDFKEYVDITLRDDEIHFESENPQEVFHEFMNYLIGIYNQK